MFMANHQLLYIADSPQPSSLSQYRVYAGVDDEIGYDYDYYADEIEEARTANCINIWWLVEHTATDGKRFGQAGT